MRLFEFADAEAQATCVLTRQFGEHSVVSIAVCEDGEKEDALETEGTQTLTARLMGTRNIF